MSLDDPNSPKAINSAGAPEAVASPHPQPAPSAAPVAPPIPPQIQDFDTLINQDVKNFVDLGEKIGSLVAEQVG